MPIKLTDAAKRASEEPLLKTNLAVEIPAISSVFGASSIKRAILIGDSFDGVPLKIGVPFGNDVDVWKIGGFVEVEGQKKYIKLRNTTTKISQKISPDRGQASGISRMSVTLIDKDQEVSKLLASGIEVDEILGQPVNVWFGFADTRFKEDYNKVFIGFIEGFQSVGESVKLLLSHVEDRKNRQILSSETTDLSAGINASVTSIPVLDTSNFNVQFTGHPSFPTGDDDLTFYALINEEIIQYTTKDATNLLTATRGALGTTAATHDSGDAVSPLWRFNGLSMDLALKVMNSGKNGAYLSGEVISNFVRISSSFTQTNAIFFKRDMAREVDAIPGTLCTTTGASNGSNNKTDIVISEVIKTSNGSYIVFDGETFVEELGTSAVISFRSAYDTFGQGLSLDPRTVDIVQHEILRDRDLGGEVLDFVVGSIKNTKRLMDDDFYKPVSCFSVAREGKASVVGHFAPLPETALAELNEDNIENPDRITTARSFGKHFANVINFEIDLDPVTEKFARTVTVKDDTAILRTQQGEKPLTIEAKGFKTVSGGVTSARNAGNRLLQRYKFGAQSYKGVRILYGTGYNILIGDTVVLDTEGLNVSNFKTGDRTGRKSLVEVELHSLDITDAAITVDLVDTAFELNQRFATWGPSSLIGSGATATTFNIKKSFNTKDFEIEGDKWEPFVGERVRIRNESYSVDEDGVIESVFNSTSGSSITLVSALSFTPLEDYIIEQPRYSTSTDDQTDAKWKLLHFHWSPSVAVVSGASETVFDVGGGDISKFQVGALVRIHNDDYSIHSAEAEILTIVSNTITTKTSLGITPAGGQTVELIGFVDGGGPYRWR